MEIKMASIDICKINPVKANIFGKNKNEDKNTSITYNFWFTMCEGKSDEKKS